MSGLQEVLDLDGLRPERRIRAWTDALYEKYYPLDVNFPSPDFNFGRLAIKDVADIRVGQVEADPFICHRQRNHLAIRGGDYYLVEVPRRQPLRIRQQGREAFVAANDFAVVGTADVYSYEQWNRNDVLTLRIPGQMLRYRIRDIDDWTARSFLPRKPSTALFVDFAKSLAQHGSELDPADAAVSVRALLDLMAIAIGTRGGDATSDETPVRIAHRQRALRLIDAYLPNCALRPSFVAQELGLSSRYLQQIFAGHDESISSVIRARRIDEAKRMLRDIGPRRRSISSIAYAVGFSDPAHFSRVFLAQTGMSPKDYRCTYCPDAAK